MTDLFPSQAQEDKVLGREARVLVLCTVETGLLLG
jgi:hypothetical protein